MGKLHPLEMADPIITSYSPSPKRHWVRERTFESSSSKETHWPRRTDPSQSAPTWRKAVEAPSDLIDASTGSTECAHLRDTTR